MLISAALLTLALPVVFAYAGLSAMSSDTCGSEDRGGICDPRNQVLAATVPLLGWLAATIAAWLLAVLLPRRSWRGWAVLACWVVAVGCVVYSYGLIGQTPN